MTIKWITCFCNNSCKDFLTRFINLFFFNRLHIPTVCLYLTHLYFLFLQNNIYNGNSSVILYWWSQMIFNNYPLGTNTTFSKGTLEYSPTCLNEGFCQRPDFSLLHSQAAFHSLLVQYEIGIVNTEKCNLLCS